MEVEDRVRRLLTKEKLKMVGGIAGEIRSGEFRFWVKGISDFLAIHLVGRLSATEHGTDFSFGLRPRPKVLFLLAFTFVATSALEVYFVLNQEQYSQLFIFGSFLLPVLVVGVVIKKNMSLLAFIKELAQAIDAPLPTRQQGIDVK